MCSPAPLNDHIPKHWEYMRSYILKDGHLFLSLIADGGIYEFEPISATAGQVKERPLTGSVWDCHPTRFLRRRWKMSQGLTPPPT